MERARPRQQRHKRNHSRYSPFWSVCGIGKLVSAFMSRSRRIWADLSLEFAHPDVGSDGEFEPTAERMPGVMTRLSVISSRPGSLIALSSAQRGLQALLEYSGIHQPGRLRPNSDWARFRVHHVLPRAQCLDAGALTA